MSEEKRCSFCAKRADELAVLIAGPTAFICDECVISCVGVLTQRVREKLAIVPLPTHKHKG